MSQAWPGPCSPGTHFVCQIYMQQACHTSLRREHVRHDPVQDMTRVHVSSSTYSSRFPSCFPSPPLSAASPAGKLRLQALWGRQLPFCGICIGDVINNQGKEQSSLGERETFNFDFPCSQLREQQSGWQTSCVLCVASKRTE